MHESLKVYLKDRFGFAQAGSWQTGGHGEENRSRRLSSGR